MLLRPPVPDHACSAYRTTRWRSYRARCSRGDRSRHAGSGEGECRDQHHRCTDRAASRAVTRIAGGDEPPDRVHPGPRNRGLRPRPGAVPWHIGVPPARLLLLARVTQPASGRSTRGSPPSECGIRWGPWASSAWSPASASCSRWVAGRRRPRPRFPPSAFITACSATSVSPREVAGRFGTDVVGQARQCERLASCPRSPTGATPTGSGPRRRSASPRSAGSTCGRRCPSTGIRPC